MVKNRGLSNERVLELKKDPKLAETLDEKLYILNSRIGVLNGLLLDLARYWPQDQTKWSNKDTWRDKRGKIKSLKESPASKLGSKVVAALYKKELKGLELITSADYAKACLASLSAVESFEIVPLGSNEFYAKAKVKNQDLEIIGGEAKTVAVACVSAIVKIALKTLCSRHKQLTEGLGAEKRASHVSQQVPNEAYLKKIAEEKEKAEKRAEKKSLRKTGPGLPKPRGIRDDPNDPRLQALKNLSAPWDE